jgi:hypothetical protein
LAAGQNERELARREARWHPIMSVYTFIAETLQVVTDVMNFNRHF